jgi:DNA-binding LytR/AlgR family response regulator
MATTPLRAFIAEDEPPARERLEAALARVAPHARVAGHAESVKGTLAWLASHPPPDVLLLDIQLADGLSLELFERTPLALPTIFTTAYDRFALDAFRALAVDYLLKPVSDAALSGALQKLQRLRDHFGADVAALLRQLGAVPSGVALGSAFGSALGTPHAASPAVPRWRQRLLCRKAARGGSEFHTLPVERLAYVVLVDKVSHAVADDGERYRLETPLAELEAELDPQLFFRANRQLLVAARAVVRFVAAGKGRLDVQLQPALVGKVLISQERAAAFKAWLGA